MEYLDKDWSNLKLFVLLANDDSPFKVVIKNVILIMYEMAKMGYYHCDIKPENIMVNHVTLKVKFIDFEDLYFNKSSNPSHIAPFTGTIGFRSPESYGKKPFDLLSSLVFNIGCVLYFCYETQTASKSVESLIGICTKIKPHERIKFHNLLFHEWFNYETESFSCVRLLYNLWTKYFK